MGRFAKFTEFRISFAVSGLLDTMKRERPTEKDMRGVAWRDLERDARMRWARGVPRVLYRPKDGPGMAEEEEDVVMRERAQARPPG